MPRSRPKPILSLLPLCVSAVCTLAAYLSAGPTAGLFFAGFIFATLLSPAFALRTPSLGDQVLSTTAVILGVAIVWLAAIALETDLTAAHLIACAALLTCYCAALLGAAAALDALRIIPASSAALVTLLGAAWLTWPIWLSPALAGHEHLVSFLTIAHPILAADHSLRALGSPWTEHRLMYNQLTNLNQDVGYQLPATILWACALHGLIAVLGIAASRARPAARRVERSDRFDVRSPA